MATAALAVTIVSAVASNVQQNAATRAEKRRNRVANRLAAVKRTRDTRRLLAQSRIQRAEVQQAGFNLGVSGGSAVQGAVGGITSDTASSVGASNRQFTGQQALAGISDSISSLRQSAVNFGGISSIAGLFAGNAGAQNRAAVSSIFN